MAGSNRCGMVLPATSLGNTMAVRLLGVRPIRIYAHPILPNMASAIIVSFTLNVPTILSETSLVCRGA